MTFSSARVVEEICYNLREAEWQRARNRALISGLANGFPPYSPDEAQANNIEVNSNDLSMTRLCQEARQQLLQAFIKPGNFFTARTDMGPVHRRAQRGVTVTTEINRLMKRSLPYYETLRSKIALVVLHGIGTSCWDGSQKWCPGPVGIGDVLIPSGTLLTFQNLPFVAFARSYTANELSRLTSGPNVDPGWNLEMVKKAIAWAEEQTLKMMGSQWSEYFMPDRLSERLKENSGFYASDLVQTIDVIDFMYYCDEGKKAGWRRKIIFDAWGGYSTYQSTGHISDKNLLNSRDQFLYDGKDRVYADRLSQIAHWQFADLTATGPFRYHSIRGLGHMLYDACHLQNRLECSFAEAVFEQLLNYVRVKTSDEAERALKIQLAQRGIIDESVQFLPPGERWQPNAPLIELGIAQYRKIIADNSGAYVQNRNFSQDKKERTAFEVHAEIQATTTLISAALQQAYKYQTFEYEEVLRRFCIPNSRDPDVREFRVRCLKRGVPEKMLVPAAWEIEPERVMGAGNKTLEMNIAQLLMENRAAFSPQAQQEILRIFTLSVTDSASVTEMLVPETPGVSDAKHDAMLAYGSLMVGAEVQFTPDQNRIEIAQTLIGELGLGVKRVLTTGGMADADKIAGFQNVLQHIGQLVQQIAQDKPQRELAKKLAEASGKLANEVKGFAQRLEQQQKAAQKQNGDGGTMAETKAKIMGTLLTAKAKAANTRDAHGQRTAQRQVAFELEQKRKDQEHQLDMRREIQKQHVEDVATDLKTAAEVRRGRLKSTRDDD